MTTTAYYSDKLDLLQRLFGDDVVLTDTAVVVGEYHFPVVDDVIITLPGHRDPRSGRALRADDAFAPDVQGTFGDQWQRFSEVTVEHRAEFDQYFDLVDVTGFRRAVVADLGCGSGRYASCIAPYTDRLVLVDFSEAIFVARRNLRHHVGAVFVMGDVVDLPFQSGAFDLAYSLGVLHHLPVPALDAVRALLPLTDELLVYLYYALDNRPRYFSAVLRAADAVRRRLCRLRAPWSRALAVWLITLGLYWPASRLGLVLPATVRSRVPLVEFYAGKSVRRLRQDAHDRFLTPVEQRVSRAEVEGLADGEWSVKVSEGLPYWHFLMSRGRPTG